MRSIQTLLVFIFASISEPALAHSPIEGIGNFNNGLLHPVLVPAHLLLLFANGLFLGQQGEQKFVPALKIFALSTFIGLIAAWFSVDLDINVFILMLSAVTGLLIAINPKVNVIGCLTIATLIGFSLGIDSAQETLSGKDKFVTLFGSGIAIYFLSFYPIGLANYAQNKTWKKIGIRIMGSWITASSVIVLALSFAAKT